ncbi:MAG: hypothetical protein KDD70_13815 [Bdellovibrionales bacterium]|nr:hypothetical protein [Bdellovibrionales bacterium]
MPQPDPNQATGLTVEARLARLADVIRENPPGPSEQGPTFMSGDYSHSGSVTVHPGKFGEGTFEVISIASDRLTTDCPAVTRYRVDADGVSAVFRDLYPEPPVEEVVENAAEQLDKMLLPRMVPHNRK